MNIVSGGVSTEYAGRVTRLPLYLLTKRRAVDLCRVRSSLCPSNSLARDRQSTH